jgi:hypothetical protein
VNLLNYIGTNINCFIGFMSCLLFGHRYHSHQVDVDITLAKCGVCEKKWILNARQKQMLRYDNDPDLLESIYKFHPELRNREI